MNDDDNIAQSERSALFRAMHANDVDLLARVGSGDQQAMALLYDRHSNLVYSVALRVCHDSALAEDVLQYLFMQIWLAPRQFASAPGSLDGRLGLLARNHAIDLIRRRKSIEFSEKPLLGFPFDPISHTEASGLKQGPNEPVLLLPDADRQILDMAFFDGKTRVEIAEATGFPVETIASRLGIALSALKTAFTNAAGVPENNGLEMQDPSTHSEFTAPKLHAGDIKMQMDG